MADVLHIRIDPELRAALERERERRTAQVGVALQMADVVRALLWEAIPEPKADG